MIGQLKKTRRKNNRKLNKRKTNRRKNNRNTNKRNYRKQRGGNFNENQLRELTTLLISIGFTNAELNNFIPKINDISQIQEFDGFMNFIRENHENDKQGLIDWLEVNHPLQIENVETDKEDSDEE
jgi:hypothetical protein